MPDGTIRVAAYEVAGRADGAGRRRHIGRTFRIPTGGILNVWGPLLPLAS